MMRRKRRERRKMMGTGVSEQSKAELKAWQDAYSKKRGRKLVMVFLSGDVISVLN